MPTFFSETTRQSLFDFTVSLASAARIFTAEQIASRSELSWYKDPPKRAREFLALFPEVFETLRSPYGVPARRRLTAKERRKRGIADRAISGISQRSEHWLGIGDVFIALTSYGGRPTEWKVEWDSQFDIYCIWCGIPLLIEYQRSPITKRQWREKWDARKQWYKSKTWNIAPVKLLICTTNQTDDTICLPRGTLMARQVQDVPRLLMSHTRVR